MIELPIYAVESSDLQEAEMMGSRPKEEIIRITLNPDKITAYHEDDENSVIFIDGFDFKIALSYEDLKGLLENEKS